VGEIALRFLLGGAIVSLFSLAGEIFKPKTFAGMFGSAPSVALAGLTLAFARDGAPYAAIECQSMMIGALGLVAYSGACAFAAARPGTKVWLSAGMCWLVWATVTFGLGALLHWVSAIA